MNTELYERLNKIRLDPYAVDQGLMLNCLVGALTGMVIWADENGKVDAVRVVEAVERAVEKSVLVTAV